MWRSFHQAGDEMDKSNIDKIDIQEKKAKLRGLTYALLLCFFMLLISSLIYITVRDDIYNEIDESHYGLIFKLEEDMNRTIEGVSEYAIYLSQFPETEKALYGHVEALENTASVMQTICQHNRGIDQFSSFWIIKDKKSYESM